MNINDLLNLRNKNLTISENMKMNIEAYKHIQSPEFIKNLAKVFSQNQNNCLMSSDIDYYNYMSTISSDPMLPICYDITSHLCFLYMALEIYDRRSSQNYRYIHSSDFSGYFIKAMNTYLFIGLNEKQGLFCLSKIPKSFLKRTIIEVIKKTSPVNIIELPIILSKAK